MESLKWDDKFTFLDSRKNAGDHIIKFKILYQQAVETMLKENYAYEILCKLGEFSNDAYNGYNSLLIHCGVVYLTDGPTEVHNATIQELVFIITSALKAASTSNCKFRNSGGSHQ